MELKGPGAMELSAGQTLSISPMTPADVPEVARLAGQLGYPSTEAQVRARFEGIAARGDHGVLVAKLGDQVAGWLHFCHAMTLASEPRLELLGLVVDEATRGNGVGSRLIAAAEEWGRKRGLRRCVFTSRITREDAHRLYRRLGYEVAKTSHVFEKGLVSG